MEQKIRRSAEDDLFRVSLGFSLKDVQEWLGHADIKMTANIYAHLDVTRKNTVAASLTSNLSRKSDRKRKDHGLILICKVRKNPWNSMNSTDFLVRVSRFELEAS